MALTLASALAKLGVSTWYPDNYITQSCSFRCYNTSLALILLLLLFLMRVFYFRWYVKIWSIFITLLSSRSVKVLLFMVHNFCQRSKQKFLWCYSFWVSLTNTYMYKYLSKDENQWVHLVLNFIRPHEGFQLFKDGILVRHQANTAYMGTPIASGNGRLVLGRRHPNVDGRYSSVDLDELVFFNRKLTGQEVETLYNKDKWFFSFFSFDTFKTLFTDECGH